MLLVLPVDVRSIPHLDKRLEIGGFEIGNVITNEEPVQRCTACKEFQFVQRVHLVLIYRLNSSICSSFNLFDCSLSCEKSLGNVLGVSLISVRCQF